MRAQRDLRQDFEYDTCSETFLMLCIEMAACKQLPTQHADTQNNPVLALNSDALPIDGEDSQNLSK